MRKLLLLAPLLFPALINAQELFPVKGRIINEQGAPVGYVHVGIPGKQIGTVSTIDGRFEIAVPADTLEFHHVSYQTALYPVSGPGEDVLIVMKDAELPPAVIFSVRTPFAYSTELWVCRLLTSAFRDT
ncbi:MAG: carboxypeptidase-like regulatory domain-containing protein [Bacteroidales bacterium]|nr:carboxypeptidase-like regulatory domain-containing protein [Bacteroidales bacterium]